MGLMNLFRKDTAQELDKANDWLAKGDPVRALETARRYTNDKDPDHRTRARDLVQQAREALLRANLEKSATAEARGDFADAADWMHAALQNLEDESRRPEMEKRRRDLEHRAESAAAAAALHVPAVEEDEYDDYGDDEEEAGFGDRDEDDESLDFDDAEAQYLLLLDTLSEPLAERYGERPADFRRAFLALNAGEPGNALPVLNQLVRNHPGDPVLRLERGRCRLMLGEAHGAREDFEAAWPELAEVPLDRDGSLTLPILWAEAALEDEAPEAVVDRLGDSAHPSAGNPDLTALYASALMRTERYDEARPFLAKAVETFPKRQDLSYALAQVLHKVGERGLAIQILERAIAPSCASGSCSKPPLHLPSLRALAGLHLDLAGDVMEGRGGGTAKEAAAAMNRVGDLLQWIAGAQGGQMAAADYLMVARYHELKGDAEAASRARDRSRSAGSGGGGTTAGAPDLTPAGGEAIL